MEKRELSTLPLAPLYKNRLHVAGFRTVQDLISVDAEILSKDTGLNVPDCRDIIQLAKDCKSCIPKPRTALQIFNRENSTAGIMTFSEKLDTALGGGIQCGMLTEICGVPGVGKTQLCLQLSCDVQIPALFGGLEGEVLYIDTKGGVINDRVTDLVEATVRHCHLIASGENDKDVQATVQKMTVEKFLGGIHIYRCHDSSELLSVVNLLPELLQQNKNIKLVVIDSVAFHFRHDFEDLSLRTRVLTNLAQCLIRTAREYKIAVVVTNQMTTRVHQGTDKGSHLVPCLGESWGHACTTRVILEFVRDTRLAWLYKSPSQPQAKIPFQITKDGIRDIVDDYKQEQNVQTDVISGSSMENTDSSVVNPAKRQKLS
ncbi:DNA repair protein RAD51 homolog 3-like [Ruditapes philippinarum]|uniref:DNA repair protein RAD51 homolog 3-like n=1 Tax=Ruditapes philippinarum TaxID=129788 RepID=UPI00295BE8A9|nr:DNA repair protein RAD51 homolog 3-like [Ruditapes philippinarum]